MHIIIAGEGRLPYFLAKSFLGKGYRVTVILPDAKEADELARQVKATVLQGNASDPGVLGSADAYYCDLLIAVTARDEDNLVISQLANLEFGVSKTLALVNDPDNTEVFHKLGVKAFSTTEMISQLIEQSVQLDEIINVLPTEEGRVLITEFVLHEHSPILGIPLRQIKRPEQSLLISIIRKDEVLIPDGNSVLQAGDKIMVLTTPQSHTSVIHQITGVKS